MVALLDANVLIAFLFADHEHHPAVLRWWGQGRDVATCPITGSALVRYALRVGLDADQAIRLLDGLRLSTRHRFWACDIDIEAHVVSGVIGHRQVTDAYLASLAHSKGGVLATFDGGAHELRPSQVELLDA